MTPEPAGNAPKAVPVTESPEYQALLQKNKKQSETIEKLQQKIENLKNNQQGLYTQIKNLKEKAGKPAHPHIQH